LGADNRPLQSGDILLFGGRGLFSWVIRFATSLALPLASLAGIGSACVVFHLTRDFFPLPAAFAGGASVFATTIAIAGPSPYSHVGFVCARAGDPLLWESTTLSDLPCLLCGKPTRGLQCVNPLQRIERYDGHVWVMRPCRAWESHEIAKALGWLVDRDGARYDLLGAIGAGPFKRFTHRRERLGRLFCSEVLVAVFGYVGRLGPRHIASSWNPTDVATRFVEWRMYFTPELIK
jgi:hypothetical protein